MSFDEFLLDDPEQKTSFPSALLRLHILLEDLGQDDPGNLLEPIDCTPIEWTVESNSYQEADTFEVVLEGNDFPYDPRIIRGATCELYQADVGSLDGESFWKTALRDGPPAIAGQLKTEEDVNQAVRDAYALILGIVDEVELEFADEKIRLRLKGRDYTAFFLDVEAGVGPSEEESGG